MTDLKPSLQYAVELAEPKIFTVEDVHGVTTQFSNKQLHQIQAHAPNQPNIVEVSTLTGIADLVRAKLEGGAFTSDFFLHIEDETTVRLVAKDSDEYGRRLQLIVARPVSFDQFRFGQWMSQEEFVIAVASKFADGADKDYVLNIASTLTNDAVRTSEDNGFNQKVTAKAGIRMKEDITLKPRVDLAPFRTFPEIEQPVSSFVFRARCNGEGQPVLQLVEADGGRWKIEAIKRIDAALEVFKLNIPIIA